MTTDWTPTAIDGVLLRHDAPLEDERGQFMELWRASAVVALGMPTMVQANLSRSHAGVLRGMHVHLHQDDLWLVLEGKAVAATTDLRAVLGGVGPGGGAGAVDDLSVRSQLIQLSVGDALFVPAGVGHGFLALTDLTLVYLVTNEYDGSDEHGFAWDDPDAAIAWPGAPEIISDRDRDNPSVRRAGRPLSQPEQTESR